MPRCMTAACAGVARRSAARMKGKGPAAKGGPSSLFGRESQARKWAVAAENLVRRDDVL